MKEIIAPIERGKIEAELTPERFLRHTNKGGNDIYVVNYKNAPNTMQEIGRLREIAFRAAGGGTAKRSTSTCTTPWKSPASNSSYGTPTPKKYWADTGLSWAKT